MQFSNLIAFNRRLCASRGPVAAAMAAACLLAASAAFGQDAMPQAQAPITAAAPSAHANPGAVYEAVPAVAADLAQVVFFRPAAAAAAAPATAAHVYVDGQLHAALLPHNFTRLCLAKGSHAIEAYVGDAPLFAGKSNPATRVHLDGGKTYFVAVSEGGGGDPQPHRRVDAERLLAGAHEQRYVISRASTVVDCREAPGRHVAATAGAT
ncbi:hypothetical protein AB4Z46_32930 [Variovorax sp. M-6]|uniref:hypothetical protein n=1 Tax=Variovorax sp. M-6 TaxID=3233041 RepID=UPI003F960FDD